MSSCAQCGHTTSDPDVSFTCVDCGTSECGTTIDARTIFGARLAPFGVVAATTGRSRSGLARRALDLANLPRSFFGREAQLARDYAQNGRPYALVALTHEARSEIVSRAGTAQFDAARRQFLENLRQCMPTDAIIQPGHAADYLLLSGKSPDDARRALKEQIASAQSSVRHFLDTKFEFVSAEDLGRWATS